MARESLSARISAGRDEGSALIAVIGIMLVLTVLAMTIISTSLFNVRMTTATRASVQAKSAAEAGIDYAQFRLASGAAACGSAFGPPTGSTVAFQVAVTCPAPGSVLVTSTGTAASSGVGGAEGNRRTMEARLSLAASAPHFNKAVFIGSGGTKLNSGWKLNGAPLGGVDVGGFYGSGDVECSSSTSVTGPIVITGNATIDKCTLVGDLFIKGDLTRCGESTIVGNLYIQRGTTGNLNCAITGSVYAAKNIFDVRGKISGNVVSSTGTITEWSNGEIGGGVTVASIPTSFRDSKVGGVSCAVAGSGTPVIYGCASKIAIANSPLPLLPAEGFEEQMPVLTAGSSWPGMVPQTWANFVRATYAKHGPTEHAVDRFATDANTCNLVASGTVGANSAGDALNGPIVSPNTPTVIDARSCGNLALRESTIVLNDDLTILVKDFASTNGFSVVKGASVSTGKTPSLRIVVPMKDGSSTCTENASAGKITFNSGGTALGADVSLLLYSAGSVDMANSMSFYGQLYACTMPEAKNNVTINFRPVGESIAGTPTTPGALKIDYLRDVS